AALNREERRIAPSFGGTATGDPSAIARAEDEPSFQHGRNHRDTLGRSHHFVRNAGIRGSLNLFQNCGGRLHPIGGFVVVILRGKYRGRKAQQDNQQQQLFHVFHAFWCEITEHEHLIVGNYSVEGRKVLHI